MATTEPTTPTKYRPSNRVYTDKDWLYERYWERLETIEEIADRADVSATTIVRQLDDHGIVRRDRHDPSEDHERLGNTLRRKYGYDLVDDPDHSVVWRPE